MASSLWWLVATAWAQQPWGDPWTARVPLAPYVEARAAALLPPSGVWFGDLWAGTPLTAGDSRITMGLSMHVNRVQNVTTDGRRSLGVRLGPDIWGIVRGDDASYHAFVMRIRQPVPASRISNWFQRLPGETSLFRVVLTYDGYMDLGTVHVSLEAGVGNADLFGSSVLLFPIGERVALGVGATLSARELHTAVATVRVRPIRDVLEIGASMSFPLHAGTWVPAPPYPSADLTIMGPYRRPAPEAEP